MEASLPLACVSLSGPAQEFPGLYLKITQNLHNETIEGSESWFVCVMLYVPSSLRPVLSC